MSDAINVHARSELVLLGPQKPQSCSWVAVQTDGKWMHVPAYVRSWLHLLCPHSMCPLKNTQGRGNRHYSLPSWTVSYFISSENSWSGCFQESDVKNLSFFLSDTSSLSLFHLLSLLLSAFLFSRSSKLRYEMNVPFLCTHIMFGWKMKRSL